MSIGIAPGTKHQNAGAVLESADAAMYEAKRKRSGYGFARVPGEPATAAARPGQAAVEIRKYRQAG